jgi:hypothetical protein
MRIGVWNAVGVRYGSVVGGRDDRRDLLGLRVMKYDATA